MSTKTYIHAPPCQEVEDDVDNVRCIFKCKDALEVIQDADAQLLLILSWVSVVVQDSRRMTYSNEGIAMKTRQVHGTGELLIQLGNLVCLVRL